MPNRIAREVAEASRVGKGATTRRPKTAHTDVLIEIARSLERLQARRRKLRKELREIDAYIKRAKHELRAMSAQIARGKGEEDELSG